MHQGTQTDILAALRAEWRCVGRTTASRRALDRLRTAGVAPLPGRVVDLDGVVGALEPNGELDRLARASLLAQLLEHATDPLVRRCLLQTLLPGIVSVARRLRFGDGIADDPRTFLADAVSEAADLLYDWAGQRRAYAAPDLLSALRCRLRRRMLAEKERRRELTTTPDRAAPESSELDRQLAVAAAHDVDAALLYARCVLGHTTAELVAASGTTATLLRRRMVTSAAAFLQSAS